MYVNMNFYMYHNNTFIFPCVDYIYTIFHMLCKIKVFQVTSKNAWYLMETVQNILMAFSLVK